MRLQSCAELCRAQITQEQVGFKLHSKGLKNHCRIQNIHKRLFWLPWRRDCGRDWSGWCKSRRKNNLEAKGLYSQSCGFSNSHVWMWELKNWFFQIVVLDSWESPWTARRSSQSILKEINPEYSLEGLMLKLKLQYVGHLMWKADSMEKTLMLRKIEGRRRRGQQRTDVG